MKDFNSLKYRTALNFDFEDVDMHEHFVNACFLKKKQLVDVKRKLQTSSLNCLREC